MGSTKKRQFPTDRIKLHTLLDRREQDLIDLQEEVQELRAAAQRADQLAITNTAAAYSVTPDMLGELLSYIQNGIPVPPELAARLTPIAPPAVENKENRPDDKDDKIEDKDDEIEF